VSTLLTIKHDGDTWRVLGEGAVRNGKTYCHLASTTRGRMQSNGWRPVQIGDWIDNVVLEERRKRDAITSYYADRAASGQASRAR
jgi:hypothetical protein